TPDIRFAPDALCAIVNVGRRISAAIAVAVVLPFVADTSAEPAPSLAARRGTAAGSSFQSSLPGTVVPPPRPAARESRAAARAARISAASSSCTVSRLARVESSGLGLTGHACSGALAVSPIRSILIAMPRKAASSTSRRIDPDVLAEFQAGLRKRYSDAQ